MQLSRTAVLESEHQPPIFLETAPKQAAASWIVRLLPSLTDVAFLMPIFFLFMKMDGAKTMLGDGDTGWHVRTGEWILRNGQVPHRDMFSYTRFGQPWFAWEWLWDVAFAWLHQRWGLAAVVLTSIVLICGTFSFLFRLVRSRVGREGWGNDFLAIGVTILAAAASSIHWLARPHLFTLFFVVLFCWILDKAAQGRERLLWLLPALTVVWTNLHGGFLAGIVIVGCYTAGEFIGGLVESSSVARGAAFGRAKRYGVVTAACFAATFINPYFYQLHTHIVEYLSDPYHFQNISEFKSVSFQNPVARYFELLLIAGLPAALWSIYRKRFADAITLLFWAHAALISARNIPIFAIVTAAPSALFVHELIGLLGAARVAPWLRRAASSINGKAAEFGAVDRIPRTHWISAAAVLVLGALLASPAASFKLRCEYDPSKYPAKALTMLRRPEYAKGIFTHDEWGDYLLYHLYPGSKVFIDGRSDFYGSKFGQRYLDVMNVKYDWQKVLDEYGVETIVLPPDAPLASTLKESRRWRPVFDDGVAIIFRPTPAYKLPAGESQAEKDRDRKVAKSTNG